MSLSSLPSAPRDKTWKLDSIDARRAHFHAKTKSEVFAKLPEEDAEEGKCGKLVKAMYGTRDAAHNWECEYVEFMKGAEFEQGMATPCVF